MNIEKPIFKTSHPIVQLTFEQQVSLCSSFLCSAHNKTTINKNQKHSALSIFEGMLKFVGWINKEAKQVLRLPLAASTLLSMAVSPLCMLVHHLTMVGQVPRIGPCCHRPMLRAPTTHRLPLQCSAWQTREVGSEWNGCASTYSPNWLLAQALAAVKEKPTNNSKSRQRRPLSVNVSCIQQS